MPVSLPETAERCLPWTALEAMPDLAADYVTGAGTAPSYFPLDRTKLKDRHRAVEAAAARPRDRSTLADVLAEQNKRWGATEATLANIEALRDENTVAVVSGQQVGLFGGPLYTLYKTLTAIVWAKQLEADTGRTVVPVFWVEGEDHDFDEVAHTTVLQRNAPVSLAYAPDDVPTGPVGPHTLGAAVEDPLQALDEALPPSDFKPSVFGAIAEAYSSETTLEDAFARLITTYFGDTGLVLINPDDHRLKALVRPLIQHDMTTGHQAAQAVEEAGSALESDGYHAQVHARPTNFFWMEPDGRYAIDANEDGTYTLRHDGRTWTHDEISARIEAHPERFSPNVVTRPLVQDQLLPTAAYVAGPGEISYFAQYQGVYAWADMPMPMIVPRASMTLVEGKVRKVLTKYDLSIADLQQDVEQLFQQEVRRSMDVDIDAAFKETSTRIHKAINDLKPKATEVDDTLGRSVEATRAAFVNELNDLEHRVLRAEKRQHDELRAQLEKAYANLFPQRGLQERTVNAAYFLNKYSLDLIDTIQAQIDPFDSSHCIIDL